MSESRTISPLIMDRSEPLGNSDDGTGRRALHVKATNVLVTEPYDEIAATYPDAVTEVYTYKMSGSTVATVTVVYTDLTKSLLLSVTKS
jgi:hypothetical protein